MYWMALLLTVAGVATVTYATVGATCSHNSECSAGECCQILSTQGTCQKYQLEGSSCYPFDKMNGYCSCEPGTQCTQHEYPITTTTEPTTWSTEEVTTSTTARLAKRTFGRPGYIWYAKCERITS